MVTSFIYSQFMRHPLIKTFKLSNLLQMPNGHGMVDVEFFRTSHVATRGSALIIALNWLLSTSDDCPLCFSTSSLPSPLQNFLNPHCTVLLLAVPGLNVWLMLQVVSPALRPTLNLNKITWICFCLASFP